MALHLFDKTKFHEPMAQHRFFSSIASLAGAGFSPYEVPKEMGIFHEITRQVEIADRCEHTRSLCTRLDYLSSHQDILVFLLI